MPAAQSPLAAEIDLIERELGELRRERDPALRAEIAAIEAELRSLKQQARAPPAAVPLTETDDLEAVLYC